MSSYNPNQYLLDRTYNRLPQQTYGAPASNSMLEQLYGTRGMLGSPSTSSGVFPIQPNPIDRQGTGVRAPEVSGGGALPYNTVGGSRPVSGMNPMTPPSSVSADRPYAAYAGGPQPPPTNNPGMFPPPMQPPMDPQRQAMEAQFRTMFPMGNPSGMAPQDLLAYLMASGNQSMGGSPGTNPFYGTSQGRVQAGLPPPNQMPQMPQGGQYPQGMNSSANYQPHDSYFQSGGTPYPMTQRNPNYQNLTNMFGQGFMGGMGGMQMPQQYLNRMSYNPYSQMGGMGGMMGGMGGYNPYAQYYQQVLARLIRGY